MTAHSQPPRERPPMRLIASLFGVFLPHRFPAASIRVRLAVISWLLAVAMVAMVATAWDGLRGAEEAAREVARLGAAQQLGQRANAAHAEMHANAMAALLARDIAGDEPLRLQERSTVHVHAFRDLMARLGALALPAELAVQVSATRAAMEEYAGFTERLVNLALAERDVALMQLPHWSAIHESAEAILTRLDASLAAAIDAAMLRSEQASLAARRQLLLAAVMTVAIVGLLMHVFARSIRRSVRHLRDVARTVAAGELGARCRSVGNDEIGELAGSLNQMACNLQEVIERMRADAEQAGFGRQLHEALEMADTEAQVHAVVVRAMRLVSADHPMELLLADSSKAHLERAAAHPLAGAPGCQVPSPHQCIAVRRGQPARFDDSEAINACPHLRGHEAGRAAAYCLPVSFMGRSLGVLHASSSAAQPQPLSATQRALLATLGAQCGARIGTVRAFDRSQAQANTDALTGLPNRRVLERMQRGLLEGGSQYSVAMCDLDHFKKLNDTYGHQTGDDALRTFAAVLRGTIRAGDLAARWGGEEFAVLLVGTTAGDAIEWADRVRARLAQIVAAGAVPPFTVSFGVADTTMSNDPVSLIQLSDAALYEAKQSGRDRACAATGSASMPVRQTSEQKAAIDLPLLAAGS